MSDVRNLRKGYVSNFYPDEFKIGIWISHDMLGVIKMEQSIIFLVEKKGFTCLYYCATSYPELQKAWNLLPANEKYIVDIVARGIDETANFFLKQNNFTKYSALYRMSKIPETSNEAYVPDSCLRNANYDDIPVIQDFFEKDFDKYVEQIPTKEELAQWIDLGHVIVSVIDNNLAGFLIYDYSPSSWYLRYWFVDSKYREKKVGASLIKEGMHRGADARRLMFWVIETNENAIKRYEHYGYKRENMTDTIYTNIIN